MSAPYGRPLCLEPMRRHGPQSDPDPVCWRPAGHTPNRHLSRRAYLRELARKQRTRGRYAR